MKSGQINRAMPWLAALFLAVQPLSGLFAMNHPGPVQWMTVCTLQGTHQIKVVLPRPDDAPGAPEVVGWACPDCVSTPPAAASFAGTDTFVPSPFPPALGSAQSVLLHFISVAGSAFPARAPPLAANLNP
ncbi:MAG: hypothetical protein L7T80_08895 [Arenicellales bacterium]|nr:hypothetical protein [Arenicellales bacterium]